MSDAVEVGAKHLVTRLEEQRNAALTSAAQAWALADTLQEQLRLRDERLGELGGQLAADDSAETLKEQVRLREAEIVRLNQVIADLKADS